jgi:tetratricopeptide (TPR) repeat protein
MKNQKIKEANQEFRSCFELKRLCGKAYTSWAVMQAFFGSKKNADECLARLQELRPNFNELYFVKGIVDEKAGDNQAAAKNFRKAIELYPHNSSPYIHLLQSPEFKIDINKKDRTMQKLGGELPSISSCCYGTWKRKLSHCR